MANQSCPQGDLWYTCTVGGYRGCCDKNPCNAGSCPRDSSSVSSASATKTSNPDSVTSILTASTTYTASPHTETPTDSSSLSASTEKRISTAAVVGGVVGGIALIVLLALLLFLFLKHRRRRNWMNHAHIHRSVSSRNPDRDTTLKTSHVVPPFFRPLASNPPTPRTPTNNFSFFNSSTVGTNAANTRLSPINESSPTRAPPVPPLPIQPIHNFASQSTRSATQLQLTPQEISSNRAKELEAPPSILRSPHEHSPPNECRLNKTTELPDTGFYRQRAELPAQCQRELINVPLNQRPNHIGPNSSKAPSLRPFPLPPNRFPNQTLLWPKQHPSKTPSPISPLSPSAVHKTPSKVITTDGVILGANLDRFSAEYRREVPDVQQGRADPQSQAHVMSFMDFEQGKCSNVGNENGGRVGALDSLIRRLTSPHIVARRRANSTVCVQTNVDPFQDERNVHKVSPLEDDVSSLGDGQPAYGDAHDVSPVREHKAPARTYQGGNRRFG